MQTQNVCHTGSRGSFDLPVGDRLALVDDFGRRVTRAADPASTPAVSCVAARDLSSWPGSLLDHLLNHLGPADLLQASRVCRKWHRAAADPDRLGASLLRAFPRLHRQQLLRALCTQPARQCPTAHERPAPPPGQRQGMEAAGAADMTGPALFSSWLLPLLGSQQFSACAFNLPRPVEHPVEQLICSPDAQWMAAQGWSSNLAAKQQTLDLWHSHNQRWRWVFSDQSPCSFKGLKFSIDSRRLHALHDNGQILTWQLDVPTNAWQRIASPPHSHPPVYVMEHSCNGQYMAAFSERHIQVFTEGGAAGWQSQWLWKIRHQWHPTPQPLPRTRPQPHLPLLRVSQTGQHLALLAMGELFIAHRCLADWQQTCLPVAAAADPPYHLNIAMNADESLLALATREGPPVQSQQAPGRDDCWITCYRFAASAGWQAVTDEICHSYALHWGEVPMAFNPDGCELVFPCLQSWAVTRLRVLSTIGPHVSRQLECRGLTAGLPEQGSRLISLQFSATGSYLGALDRISVHIWWRDPVAGWGLITQVPAADIGPEPQVHLAFSPDGYHCAVARGSRGDVSVRGPGKGRPCTQKMRRTQEDPVRQLLFTPDASQLVMVGAQLQYLPLMPAPERRHQGAGFRGEFPG